MSCYSGGSKGLVLDYASDLGATMAPLTAQTRAQLKTMIDPGLTAENPLDTGPSVGCGRRNSSRSARWSAPIRPSIS